MKLARWTYILAVLTVARPVKADPFGGEHLTLGMILKQVTDAATSARDNLKMLRENTEFAADTAMFAREMVQVGKNTYTIVENPAEFIGYMTRSWYRAFPELYESLANVYDVRESIRQASNPSEMADYDPYAYVRAFDRLVGMNESGFNAWAHAVDRWGINKPHDDAIAALRKQHDLALQNVADVVNLSGLSPTQASIYTARATAVSAVAQTEATASLQSLNRTLELGMISLANGQESARVERHRQEIAGTRIHTEDWNLDPMKGRRSLKW